MDDIGAGELRRSSSTSRGCGPSSPPYNRPGKHGFAGHTVNGYLRALRAFWSSLVREELVAFGPFDRVRVRVLRLPRKVTPTFSDQLRALLGAVPRDTATAFRDWTMLVMLLDAGMRASDVTASRPRQTYVTPAFVAVCIAIAKCRAYTQLPAFVQDTRRMIGTSAQGSRR